jgi:GMP synthase (glutamine-hydrolysing)
MILIIDFGSQTTHLIGRRINDSKVEVKIVNPKEAFSSVIKYKPRGIILSGGPSSVYGKDALLVDNEIFELGIPILGICYGLQIMGQMLGGNVAPGKRKEYGPTTFTLIKTNSLFSDWGTKDKTFTVWMSHFDQVISPPIGAVITGSTKTVEVASFADEKRKLYGIQFHPEVHHTKYGSDILNNFIFKICSENPLKDKSKISEIKKFLKERIGKQKAICALSGGIDSSVAAYLTYQVIGRNLTCIYVDTGLMRKGETEEIKNTYKNKLKLPVTIVNAEKEFLSALKGVTDPEEKRKIIGRMFIRVFENETLRLSQGKDNKNILIQGTIYPDVIESKGSLHADNIKTHHNVGGIPSKHKFKIVEPLRMFYKDEVRAIAKGLGFPEGLIKRHVFPGPGLAVRIIGEVTKEKLDILRKADEIVVEEIKKSGLYNDIWMAFAVFTNVKSTGVTGDERKYGETIAIRAIESKDTMTADWVRLPYPVLSRISERIVTEVFEVVRVVYDITTKPPATMEWE